MPTLIEHLKSFTFEEKEAMLGHVATAKRLNDLGEISRVFNNAPLYHEKVDPFVKLYNEILFYEEGYFNQRKALGLDTPSTLQAASSQKISEFADKILELAIEELFEKPGRTIKPKIEEILKLKSVIDHFVARSEKTKGRKLTPEEKGSIEEIIKSQLVGAYSLLIQEQIADKTKNNMIEFFQRNSENEGNYMIPRQINKEIQEKIALLKEFKTAISEITEFLSDNVDEIKNSKNVPIEEKGFIIAVEEFKNALEKEKDPEKKQSIIKDFKENDGKQLAGMVSKDQKGENIPDTDINKFKWRVKGLVANLESVLESRSEFFPNKQTETPEAAPAAPPSPPPINTVGGLKKSNKAVVAVDAIDFLNADLNIREKINKNERLRATENKKDSSINVKVFSKNNKENIDEFTVEKNKITSKSTNKQTYEAMLDVVILGGGKDRPLEILASDPQDLLNLANVCKDKGFTQVRMRLGRGADGFVEEGVLENMVNKSLFTRNTR